MYEVYKSTTNYHTHSSTYVVYEVGTEYIAVSDNLDCLITFCKQPHVFKKPPMSIYTLHWYKKHYALTLIDILDSDFKVISQDHPELFI